ncbi:hypothetical protein NOS3756_56150 (plasmid) [Nostoc sp. NIES-3756]|nr:hypothetical protein NOS3756_56150 [Nostoc sp. NIES-3756]
MVVVIPQAMEVQHVAVFMFVLTPALMALLFGVIGAEGKLISAISLPTAIIPDKMSNYY